jgi:copper(I)-binding protein
LAISFHNNWRDYVHFNNGQKEIMRKFIRFGWLAAALLAGFTSYSGHATGNVAGIETGGGWIRATAPGQDQAGADLSITSRQSATLIGASSPVCRTVQLHTMTMEGGMMRMREVKEIELPAGKRVNIRDSGYHLMMIGLKAPLKEGETVPLTLSIRLGKGGVVKIRSVAEVKSLTAAPPRETGHQQMNMQMN